MALSEKTHLIFDQLNRILSPDHDGTFSSEPSDKDLNTCHGISSKTNKRCLLGNGVNLKEVRREMHGAISAGLDSSQTVEAQRELVSGYVGLLHCGKHRSKAVDKIRQHWTPLVTHDHGQDHNKESDSDAASILTEDVTLVSSSSGPDISDDSLLSMLPAQQSPPDPRIASSLAALARDSLKDSLKSDETAKASGSEILLVNLGVASAAGLWRRCSVRDKSPLSKELYLPLTPSQQNTVGKLYILQHNEETDIWKVGWTTRSAEVRMLQPGNCYGVNTTIVHQSALPFAGAHKAERLAHAYLAERSLHIRECRYCKRGHREWFRGPWDEIYSAVRIMEGLLQLPGYELRDGQMKLSSQVHEIFERNWTSSMADLDGLINNLGAKGDNLPLPDKSCDVTASKVDVTASIMKDLTISDQPNVDKIQRHSIVIVNEVEVDGSLNKASASQTTTLMESIVDTSNVNSEKEPSSPTRKPGLGAAAMNLGRTAGEIFASGQDMWERYASPLAQGFKEGMEEGLQARKATGRKEPDHSPKHASKRMSDGLKRLVGRGRRSG